MPKYKRVNEDIVDTFINKLFLLVGKGLESATIRSLSKSDPELAKQMKDLKQTRKDIEKTITRKQRSQMNRNELPDVIKQVLGR